MVIEIGFSLMLMMACCLLQTSKRDKPKRPKTKLPSAKESMEIYLKLNKKRDDHAASSASTDGGQGANQVAMRRKAQHLAQTAEVEKSVAARQHEILQTRVPKAFCSEKDAKRLSKYLQGCLVLRDMIQLGKYTANGYHQKAKKDTINSQRIGSMELSFLFTYQSY